MRTRLLSTLHIILTLTSIGTTIAWVPAVHRPALASAMTPLFPTQAWEGKEFRVTELQDMFARALQNFQEASHTTTVDTNVQIAASVATAVRGHHVVSNAEMYELVRQGLDHIIATLAQVLAQLEGLSIEQKIAAAIATVVISYPISYQQYQNELAEEERQAAAKKAALAKKKKAEAAKAKAEKENVKGKDKKTKEAVVAAKDKKVAPGPKGANKETKEVVITAQTTKAPASVEITAHTTQALAPVETPVTPVAPVVTVQVPASPRVIESIPVMGNRAEDGGMDAYARAYAAMLSQVQAVQVAEPVTEPVTPTPVPMEPPVRISTGGTASYLESLSRQT